MGDWNYLKEVSVKVKPKEQVTPKALQTYEEPNHSIGARIANTVHKPHSDVAVITEMIEQLYAATSEWKFKQVKKDFAKEHPGACARMLKDPSIMYTVPKEFRLNAESMAFKPKDTMASHSGMRVNKPVQKYSESSGSPVR